MGSILSKSVNSIYTECEKSTFAYSAYSSINGYRKNNEDSHILTKQFNDYYLNGVFDGHGGDICSKYISDNLGNYLFDDETTEEITKESIRQQCVRLDKKFLKDFDMISDSGTTATFSIIKKTEEGKYKTIICNIGDSMTIILKKDNNYEPLFFTNEHKPDLDSEKDRIVEGGGFVSNGRVMGQLAVSRAFGDAQYKKSGFHDTHYVTCIPDVTEFECEDGDIVVHICDGITESNFTPYEVCNFIQDNINKYNDLRILTSLLCLEALHRQSRDNLSCMIIKLGSCDTIEFKCDVVPGPYYSTVGFYEAYEAMTFDFDIKDILNKRLDIIAKYESEHNYESEFENVLLKHHLIETPDEFEEEKKIIKKILSDFENKNTSTIT
jgi:serine/threonine protein phosphatase PrpC